MDPINFEHDLRVTIQALGWNSHGTYEKLADDIASVAFWYQAEPHAPFPKLPPLPAARAALPGAGGELTGHVNVRRSRTGETGCTSRGRAPHCFKIEKMGRRVPRVRPRTRAFGRGFGARVRGRTRGTHQPDLMLPILKQ